MKPSPSKHRYIIIAPVVLLLIFVVLLVVRHRQNVSSATSSQAGDTAGTLTQNNASTSPVTPPAQSTLTVTPGQSTLRNITVGGFARTYHLYVPKDAAGKGPLPLIIVLHGSYGTGEQMEKGMGFDPYADQDTFLVAYPDAYTPPGKRQSARWNDGRGTLESTTLGVDDVAFMRALVADVSSVAPLNTSRLYVTGASNGGIMTYRIGCEAADLFAGIAPDAAAVAQPISGSCTPVKPIAVLDIHGVADPIVPYTGGEVCQNQSKLFCEKGYVLSSAQSLSYFVKVDGCGTTPTSENLPVVVNDGTSVTKKTYPSCSTPVEAFAINGGGHAWPPVTGKLALFGSNTSGISSQNLDTTKEVVNFFMSLPPR